jgi:AcrR family transcriptional regulator
MTNETGQRILSEAHDLFMQFGLKSVSMDDIASKTGVSKKTIYQFYSDKEHLVAEVVTNIINENQQNCDIDAAQSTNAIHEVFLAMEQMTKLFHDMNPSILFDLHKYYPKAFKIFHRHKNEFIYNKIKDNIKRGIKEELYRDDFNIEIMSRYRVEAIVVPFKPEFQMAVKENLAIVSEALSTNFLFGIASQKGHKLIVKYLQNKNNK